MSTSSRSTWSNCRERSAAHRGRLRPASASFAGRHKLGFIGCSCCTPPGTEVFDERFARRMARRYRRRGLDPTAKLLFDAVRGKGSTVLEIGGGVGEIELELLRAGAARATNLELTPVYDNEAEQLLREAGLEKRAERRHGDIVTEPGLADPADVVVMHRVVCCYPDMPALIGAAADKTRRALALSFPRDTWWMRFFARAFNAWRRLRRDEFRFFVHSPKGIVAAARAHGLDLTREHEGRVWRVAALERP